MNPTLSEAMFEINVAIVMVAVTVVLFVWFQRSQAAASAIRRMRMMTHVGLEPGFVTHGDPQTEAIMKEVRSRCGRCRLEDYCDRWCAGNVKGDNAFCPNARILRDLARTSGRAG